MTIMLDGMERVHHGISRMLLPTPMAGGDIAAQLHAATVFGAARLPSHIFEIVGRHRPGDDGASARSHSVLCSPDL
jgi:hypothetical protein